MIRNLNAVIAEKDDGTLETLYLGKDRPKALEVFASTDKKPYRCVVHLRNPRMAARRFPLKLQEALAKSSAAARAATAAKLRALKPAAVAG